MTLSLNMFWGTKNFTSKLSTNKAVQKAFTYWMVNVVEQNRNCSNFLLILANLKIQIERFLYNQWTEFVPETVVEDVCSCVFQHLLATR